jgi:hypothetical protein
MRWAWAAGLACAIACSKADDRATPTVALVALHDAAMPSIDAGATPIPAGSAVDLTNLIPITITLSSTVANASILPEHVADGDLSTAWNSRTDDPAPSISIMVPPGAVIREVRMTVGFTAMGPKHEDYFTMNERIRGVQATGDDGTAETPTLDIASRALQTIPIVSRNRVRIAITDVVPGSKPSWHEVAVSELEVWGSPPAGWIAPRKPLSPIVRVVPTGTTASEATPIIDVDGPCFDGLVQQIAFAAEQRAQPPMQGNPGDEDHNYSNECFEVPAATAPVIDPAWAIGIGYCAVNDSIYGPTNCTLPLRHDATTGELAIQYESAKRRVVSYAVSSSPHAGGSRLIVQAAKSDGEDVVVCKSAPTIACSAPIENAGSATPALDGDVLVLGSGSGARHPLDFTKH